MQVKDLVNKSWYSSTGYLDSLEDLENLERYIKYNLIFLKKFKGIITSTEFLAKDIYDRICSKLKSNYYNDYKLLHKLKITLTESNVAWASFEQEIEK